MNYERKVIIDAGHGGMEPGALFEGRKEKDDNLRLALAVGEILLNNGVDVAYTRVTDEYQTPLEKAQIANYFGADYFLSLHRNAMPEPGTASGVESLVYADEGAAPILAGNINRRLEEVGFQNLGVNERPGLIVLKRTKMPAVLTEVGFLDNPADNQFFEANFDKIANAIAQGVIDTVAGEERGPEYYQIQVGYFDSRPMADQLLDVLRSQNFPAFIIADGNEGYKVRVGAYLNLDNAARTEMLLRNYGYNTYMVREPAQY